MYFSVLDIEPLSLRSDENICLIPQAMRIIDYDARNLPLITSRESL